jgi:bacillaene synthase trans-acting acyltransferase
MRPIIFMFSGQGSQYYQMGREFYDSHPVFRKAVDDGDAIVRGLLGRSVRDEIFSSPISREFNDFLISHPALVVIEHATCRMLTGEGIEPHCVWGCSAGEFAAAIAAGAWDLETALRATVTQARQVIENCPPGGMLAVLASPALFDEIDDLRAYSTLAAVNYANHFILSGLQDGLRKVETILRNKQVVYQRLPVPFGFHSPAIDAAAAAFNTYCSTLPKLPRPSTPMLSSLTAAQVTAIEATYFWQVVRQPIRFSDALKALNHIENGLFIDCGPSGTLATLLNYAAARTGILGLPVLSPYKGGKNNLQKIKECISAMPGREAHQFGAENRHCHVTS